MDKTQQLMVFAIDDKLRTITMPNNGSVFGVSGDIEVNQVEFQMPRYCAGFDMTDFTGRVNYVNPNGDSNYYESEISGTDDTVSFIWLMKPDVTRYSGDVKFSVKLYKKQDGKILKQFNTRSAVGRVLEGFDVIDSVTPEEQETLLHKIEAEIKEEVKAYIDQYAEDKVSEMTQGLPEAVNSLKEDIGNIITTKTSKQLFDDKIVIDNKIYQAVYHSSGLSDYVEQEGWKIIGMPLNIAMNKAIKLRTNVNTYFKFMCFNADGKFSVAIESTTDSTVLNSDGTYTVTIPYQDWDVINYIAFEFLATGFTKYPIVTYESDYDPNITFFGKVVSLSDNFNVPYLDEEISKVNKKIVNIEEKISPSSNPCDYTGDEICIFGKGLLIGDSLTEGVFDCNESGSQDGFRHATMNYPSNLARITGINFTNKGDAGKTIKAWYEAHKSDDLSGHDFCIIALGVNDVYFNKGWTSDAETYLTNIINKVKTENNKIPIFIVTIPMFFAGYEGADFEGMSQHIRTFAESNSLYLVDFRTYFTEFSSDSYTKYGVTYYAHHNALGYYKIAHAYKSYISYIISKNIDDFKNVQFVGTNHSWTQNPSN